MIICAGSVNLDLIARVPRLPQPGETLAGTSFSMAPGGKGANQALAARRAGRPVAMFGAVGDDANAVPALALLDEAGIDLAGVKKRTGDVPTGVALILVDDKSGENEIVVIGGANATLGSDISDMIAWADHSTVLLQMEIPDAANHAVLAAARGADARTLLNIAPYAPGAGDLASMADITIANETEFDALAEATGLDGASRHEKALDFANRHGATIVVTLGADGAFAATPDGLVNVNAPLIEPVDTVGAGDTFCGYLATGLDEGLGLADAMTLAARAGALACLARGAQPAIPSREAVDAFH
jgi:ribokinase